MTGTDHSKDIRLGEFQLSLLSGGPLFSLLVKAGIARPGAGIGLRILFFVALTWIPLALITLWQGTFLNATIKVPFLYDFAEACRFLFVLPTLIVAEVIVEPWLAQVIGHCRRLLSEADVEKFNKCIAMALHNRDSVPVELLLVLLAFLRPHLGDLALSSDISSWRSVQTNAGIAPTTAFLWYLYVAKPVIGLLWLRWLWKYTIWSQLLFRISKLALRVTPTHPDRMGGLGFIAVGQTRFAILYFAIAAVVASYIGEEIVFAGGKLMSFQYIILTTVMLSPVVFLTPLLAFTPKLLESKRRGLLEYSALADLYTKEFHEKWIEGKRDDSEVLLGNSDIQSLADLASSFEIVQEMKPVIISKTTVMVFLAAALIPFTPLLLTVYPFNELLARIWKMVF
jgi:hypothetical protein